MGLGEMGKLVNRIRKFFCIARKAAESGDSKDAKRTYRIGAVGVRTDGAIVISNNICTRKPYPTAHAEARLTKKLNVGSVVYVVRIGRDNRLLPARPCKNCRGIMAVRRISRCYYSISDHEYGILEWNKTA